MNSWGKKIVVYRLPLMRVMFSTQRLNAEYTGGPLNLPFYFILKLRDLPVEHLNSNEMCLLDTKLTIAQQNKMCDSYMRCCGKYNKSVHDTWEV